MGEINKLEIGLRVKELRGKLTQQEFANLLGVGRVSIARYETGERTPDAEFLFKAQQILGADIVYLLTGIRSMSVTEQLSPREAALLDNYRHVEDENDKKLIERAAFLAATTDEQQHETTTKKKRA